MSLKFAILTSLTEREGSGIELARRFDKSIGFFWPATHQQIYRELDRLATAELIRELPQEGPPRRGQPRRFAVTSTGRALLEEWIGELDEPEPLRASLAVRVRAAAITGRVDEVRRALEHHRELRRERLEQYLGIEQRDFSAVDPTDVRGVLQHRVLTLGIDGERSWLTWCGETLRVLDGLPPGADALLDPLSMTRE
ncbi:PadR family transcriptional regulator [Dietzia sp. NCCP-2495]|uniref:PadR family transcriptional regulator n=1 Tax=Dietzia sp. NCCP-2495 TaxID=2934675 RepID=UPI0022308C2D|nr:PadR family transcriptional regulator [Dietzia sp. NCCP-2495]GLB63780.1 PadR family transcriptional regulator [Dietzia sp. NCCP-2495]